MCIVGCSSSPNIHMSFVEELKADRHEQPVHRLGSALMTLGSDSLVYMFGSGLLGLGGFILVPLYTRTLHPDQFGVYALVDISILIIALVTQLKLDVAYLKAFADIDSSQRRDLLGSMLLTGAGAAVLGGVALTSVMASPLSMRIFQTNDHGFAWILLPIVVLENLLGLLLSHLRVERRAFAYCSSTLARLLAIVAASVWLLSVRHLGLYGLFLGRLVGNCVGVALLFGFCWSGIRLRIDWPLLRRMIAFGIPLVWSALMILLMDATGRYMLGQVRSLNEVGYLGAAIKISSVFQMLITRPFGIAWGGLMFHIARWPNAPKIYSKIFTYVLVLSLVGGFCMALFTPELFHIFATKAYAPGMGIFPLILLVRAVSIMEYPAAISIYLAERTKWFALVYSIGLGVNLICNYILDRTYGATGAVWAWILAWLVIVALMRLVGQGLYRLENDWLLWSLAVVPWAFFFFAPGILLAKLSALPWPTQAIVAACVLGGFATLLVADFRMASKGLHWETVES
jgi:O-antigen/teichoic acid export membrane protein